METGSLNAQASTGRPRWLRPGAAIAVAVTAGLVAWLVIDRSSPSSRTPPAQSQARVVSAAELTSLARTLGHPLYWAGPEAGARYELTRTAGRVYVRYLTPGAAVGDDRPAYLTVATYPVTNAIADLNNAASRNGNTSFALPGGGLAVAAENRRTNVYLAQPGSDLEVEVFDPRAGEARRLVEAGRIQALDTSSAGVPQIVSPAELTSLSRTLGHPLYWAGAEAGARYELTRTDDGRVFVRYLTGDARAGNRRPAYLTVATYPVTNASAALRKAAHLAGNTSLAVPGGGLAVLVRDRATGVYLAFPGTDVEVEVFDPRAGAARRLVAGGRIQPVR